MPLNDVGRGYADKLFQNSLEEILKKENQELADVRADYARRNMTPSGAYIAAHGRALVEQTRLLAEAKVDSLLKAYEKSGLPFDQAAMNEITAEVSQFCISRQHHAAVAVGQVIFQAFGDQQPTGLDKAVTEEIERGISAVIARLARNLSIRRDEVILDEMRVRKVYAAGLGKEWDAFVCHASEDKEEFARPLARALDESGLSVWYDESTLKVGDSLRAAIDNGLAHSRFGIVVLSNNFFAKTWPQQELDGLISKEVAGVKVILPVWHNISLEEVRRNSPMLAGRVAAKSSDGLHVVVRQLREAMGLQ